MQISRAEALAKVVNFHNKDDVKLYNLIKGYNSNQHACVISYAIFRVWNAVKAIFGQSNWQKAIKMGEREIKSDIELPNIPQITRENKSKLVSLILNSSRIDKALKNTLDNMYKNMLVKLNYVNKLSEKGNDYLKVTEFISSDNPNEVNEFANVVLEIVANFLKISKAQIVKQIDDAKEARMAEYRKQYAALNKEA
jgi:predicted house-cleaning noncanonical NTP pyrophosphatase (MazG superfamily)